MGRKGLQYILPHATKVHESQAMKSIENTPGSSDHDPLSGRSRTPQHAERTVLATHATVTDAVNRLMPPAAWTVLLVVFPISYSVVSVVFLLFELFTGLFEACVVVLVLMSVVIPTGAEVLAVVVESFCSIFLVSVRITWPSGSNFSCV